MYSRSDEVVIAMWITNRYLKEKWINFYSNPKNSKKEYMLLTVAYRTALIIIVWGIFLYLIFAKTNSVRVLIYAVVGILLTLYQFHTWILDYLKFSWQPIKVRISNNGMEIINLFGKYKIIKWKDIKKIEHPEGRKNCVVTIIPRPKPPPIIAPRKINIGLDLEIGSKVLEQWKLYLSKNGHRQDIKRGGHKNE